MDAETGGECEDGNRDHTDRGLVYIQAQLRQTSKQVTENADGIVGDGRDGGPWTVS